MMKPGYSVMILVLVMLVPVQAVLLGEYTFNDTGSGTLAQRMPAALGATSVAAGLTLSPLGTNTTTQLDFGGFNNTTDTPNDGFSFGNNSGNSLMWFYRAESGIQSAWGSAVGTGVSTAPLNFTLTADGSNDVVVDRISIDQKTGTDFIYYLQEAGAARGTGHTIASAGVQDVALDSPAVIAAGTSKTFTILFNSGAFNQTDWLDGIAVNGIVASSQTFNVNGYRLEADPADDWGVTIRRALADAAAYSALGTGFVSVLNFENQTYPLAERAGIWPQIDLFEVDGMILEGNGAELVCHPSNRHFGLWESSGITIRGFQLDYDPKPFTQGVVSGINPASGFFDVLIEDGYDMPALGSYPENWRADVVFTDTFGKYTHSWGRVSNVWQEAGFETNRIRLAFQSSFTNVINAISDTERIGIKIDYGPADRTEKDVRAVDGDYKTAGSGNIEIRRCEDLWVNNVDSFAAPQMTTYVFGSRNVFLDNFNVVQKPGTGRIMASNKDGFHCKSSPVPPIITNCRLERLADDAINISDMADVIHLQLAANRFETHYSDNILSGSVLADGQRVLIVDRAVPAKVGEATVSNVVEINYRNRQLDLIDISYESGFSAVTTNHVFYLKREAPAEVRNCGFGASLKTGLLSRGPLLAQNNVFTDTAYGIHSFYEIDSNEGPYAYGLEADGNTFNSVTIGGIVCFISGANPFNTDMEIVLTNNVVNQDDPGHGIKLTNINGADILDNALSFDPSVSAVWEDVLLVNCININLSGNTEDRSTPIMADPDWDKDGMDDAWELSYFGVNAAPDSDPDLDAADNFMEFIAGMDPTNAASVFAVVGSTQPLSTHFIVQWPSVSNRLYGVEWSDSLTHTFQNLASDIEFPASSFTDTLHHAESCGFYQINASIKP